MFAPGCRQQLRQQHKIYRSRVGRGNRDASHRECDPLFHLGPRKILGEQGVYGHGWPTSLAPKEQMKVPLAIWASPSFIAKRKDEWASLRTAASKAAASNVTHDYFFHTLLGCSGVRSTLLRSDLNLCANDIIASSDSLVRVGSGRLFALWNCLQRLRATVSGNSVATCVGLREKEPGPGSQCCWTTTKPASSDLTADVSLLGNRNLLSNSN